jgi:C4-dicarboxylate-specific signal transduction histidine kinase
MEALRLLMDRMWRLLCRRRAEEELKKHRDHLEELVAERTAALQQANDRLTREIADRQRAEQEPPGRRRPRRDPNGTTRCRTKGRAGHTP